MPKDSRPYKAQKRTYLQGTLLKLFDYHCNNNDLKAAEYLRQLVVKDVRERYDINETGGVVKLKRS